MQRALAHGREGLTDQLSPASAAGLVPWGTGREPQALHPVLVRSDTWWRGRREGIGRAGELGVGDPAFLNVCA